MLQLSSLAYVLLLVMHVLALMLFWKASLRRCCIFLFTRKGKLNITFISPQAIAIRENIGYPEYLTNKTALALMFKGVSML